VLGNTTAGGAAHLQQNRIQQDTACSRNGEVQDLGEMTEAVEEAKQSVILVNPILKDIPGHSGIMGIKGREGRVKFADSFEWAYHFRLLFVSGYFYPIKGALRKTFEAKWEVSFSALALCDSMDCVKHALFQAFRRWLF
jgi:hypothetical protein